MLTYLPVMNLIFHSAPIDLDAWFKIVAAGVITYMILEFEKKWLRRRAGREKGN